MRILLTNDDGVDSRGLVLLEERLREDHDIWVVAPDSDRSGCSHAVTLDRPTRVRRIGEQRLTCSGSPADCVLVAHLGIVPKSIDLVLSGINHGPNLGTDTIYSGTAAAARQGALEGTPSAALSLYGFGEPYDFSAAVEWVAHHVDGLTGAWMPGTYLNVNFPRSGSLESVRITAPCRRAYRDRLETHESPRGDLYCFLGGELPGAEDDATTDYQAVEEGLVSLSAIEIHPNSRDPGSIFFG